jgi:hypothetical protein
VTRLESSSLKSKRGGTKVKNLLLVVTSLVIGCGGRGRNGNGSNPSQQNAVQSGVWEFVFTSNVTNPNSVYYTAPLIVDANVSQNGNEISSSKAITAIDYVDSHTVYVISSNVTTPFVPPSITGVVSAPTTSFSVGGTLCGDCSTINAVGTISGNTMSGTWTDVSPNADKGTFTAQITTPLSGMYSGNVSGSNAPVSVGLTVGASVSMTADFNGTNDTFTGNTLGNMVTLSGTVSGTTIHWVGYHDATGTYLGTANSIWIMSWSNIASGGGPNFGGSGLLTGSTTELSLSVPEKRVESDSSRKDRPKG